MDCLLVLWSVTSSVCWSLCQSVSYMLSWTWAYSCYEYGIHVTIYKLLFQPKLQDLWLDNKNIFKKMSLLCQVLNTQRYKLFIKGGFSHGFYVSQYILVLFFHQRYLLKNSYDTATHNDLWAALSEVCTGRVLKLQLYL